VLYLAQGQLYLYQSDARPVQWVAYALAAYSYVHVMLSKRGPLATFIKTKYTHVAIFHFNKHTLTKRRTSKSIKDLRGCIQKFSDW